MPATRSCDVFIDGASRGNPGPSGIGAAFYDGGASPVKQLSRPLGHTTNNVAEYLACIYALQDALQEGYSAVAVKTDSELLVRQLSGQYKVRDPLLKLFHDLVVHLMQGFERCTVTHVPRTQNKVADRLAGQAADKSFKSPAH